MTLPCSEAVTCTSFEVRSENWNLVTCGQQNKLPAATNIVHVYLACTGTVRSSCSFNGRALGHIRAAAVGHCLSEAYVWSATWCHVQELTGYTGVASLARYDAGLACCLLRVYPDAPTSLGRAMASRIALGHSYTGVVVDGPYQACGASTRRYRMRRYRYRFFFMFLATYDTGRACCEDRAVVYPHAPTCFGRAMGSTSELNRSG